MPNIKATKAHQKRSDAVLESFHKYYAAIWGEERWFDALYPALSRTTRYCALVNLFGDAVEVKDDLHASRAHTPGISPEGTSEPSHANDGLQILVHDDDSTFPTPRQVASNFPGDTVLSHWNLDYASVLAACLLHVQPGEKVLDLCAAPGGKSIVLAQMLWPNLHHSTNSPATDESVLHSNELDQTRHKRLLANLQSYLPSQLFAANTVNVLRVDGASKTAVEELPLGPCGYDKVLVDAPCSSERHIIHAHTKAVMAGQVSEEMSNWKSSHTKTLARTQLALLMTALKAVKLDGTVLYATCSLSSEENDMVINRAIEAVKKQRSATEPIWKAQIVTEYGDTARVRAVIDATTEATTHGRIALPDHPAGGKWGPLYFCVLRKIACNSRKPA